MATQPRRLLASSVAAPTSRCPALGYPRALRDVLPPDDRRHLVELHKRLLLQDRSVPKATGSQSPFRIKYLHLLAYLAGEGRTDERAWRIIQRVADRVKDEFGPRFVILNDFFSYRSYGVPRMFYSWHQDFDFWLTGDRCTSFNVWIMLDSGGGLNHTFDIFEAERHRTLYDELHRKSKSSSFADQLHQRLCLSQERPDARSDRWGFQDSRLPELPQACKSPSAAYARPPLPNGDALIVRQLELHRTDDAQLRPGQWRLGLGFKVLEARPMQGHVTQRSPFGQAVSWWNHTLPCMLRPYVVGQPPPTLYDRARLQQQCGRAGRALAEVSKSTMSAAPAAVPTFLPSHRFPSAPAASSPSACASTFPAPRHPLVIATHQFLYQLDASGCLALLSAGHGHYYGAVRAFDSRHPEHALGALLVGTQSKHAIGHARNVTSSMAATSDGMLLVDVARRHTVGAWALPTSYLHDTIRTDDGALLSVDSVDASVLRIEPHADDAAGHPSEERTLFSLPWAASGKEKAATTLVSLQLRRKWSSALDPSNQRARLLAHPNGVGLALSHLWVLNNNLLRPSNLTLIDLSSGRVRPTAVRLGAPNCHSAIFHRGDVLYLASSAGGLERLGADGKVHSLWRAGENYFTKGLAVVDDVAYFGLSTKATSAVARNWVQPELVAFDIARGRLLWRQPLPAGSGLINTVSAPAVHAAGCTWRACSSAEPSRDADVHAPDAKRWQALLGTHLI